MGGNAIVSWFIAGSDPRSLASLTAASTDGAILVWVLALIGVALLLDAGVNDFLPARFRWRTAVRQRHFILMAMAFCYCAQLYVGLSNYTSIALLVYYLWNVCAIMLVTFVDANQRSRDATCVITYS
jgi:hypothetical protein